MSTATPDEPLHRVLAPLIWDRRFGPTDGDVKVNNVAGERVYTLRAQPRGAATPRGVSFFVPDPQHGARAHARLGQKVHGCGVTVPQHPLPEHLRFSNDGPLMLPLEGEGEKRVASGQHWTLYTAVDMPANMFEQLYAQLLSTSTPCEMGGGADVSEAFSGRQLDEDTMPTERLAYVAAEALEALAKSSSGNTAMFAQLWGWHVRASNLAFSDILRVGNLAGMVATALDRLTIHDPMMHADALHAQQLLKAELGDYEPAEIAYQPYWDTHPFQFLSGRCDADLCQQETANVAPAFVHDKLLQQKVLEHAQQLLQQLEGSPQAIDQEATSFEHRGLTWRVICALGKERVSSGGSRTSTTTRGDGGATVGGQPDV